jgi:ribosomal protein S18 acetylase RimI-like enzyme
MPDFTLRPAVPDDIPAVLELWRTAAEGTSITDDPAGLARLLEHDPEALIVAQAGGRIVGTVVAAWDGWRGHLYRLAVDPASRRRGIGSALVAAAEARLETAGGRRVDALVLDDNAAGRVMWTHAGYDPETQWTRWTKSFTG